MNNVDDLYICNQTVNEHFSRQTLQSSKLTNWRLANTAFRINLRVRICTGTLSPAMMDMLLCYSIANPNVFRRAGFTRAPLLRRENDWVVTLNYNRGNSLSLFGVSCFPLQVYAQTKSLSARTLCACMPLPQNRCILNRRKNLKMITIMRLPVLLWHENYFQQNYHSIQVIYNSKVMSMNQHQDEAESGLGPLQPMSIETSSNASHSRQTWGLVNHSKKLDSRCGIVLILLSTLALVAVFLGPAIFSESDSNVALNSRPSDLRGLIRDASAHSLALGFVGAHWTQCIIVIIISFFLLF